ncbi:hypothetical protein BDW22DRAFT_1422009 [Trametopsis cervina]|nr:hypothetical protein BDW22DRAFT_1422009 [Trametopsis cervina]
MAFLRLAVLGLGGMSTMILTWFAPTTFPVPRLRQFFATLPYNTESVKLLPNNTMSNIGNGNATSVLTELIAAPIRQASTVTQHIGHEIIKELQDLRKEQGKLLDFLFIISLVIGVVAAFLLLVFLISFTWVVGSYISQRRGPSPDKSQRHGASPDKSQQHGASPDKSQQHASSLDKSCGNETQLHVPSFCEFVGSSVKDTIARLIPVPPTPYIGFTAFRPGNLHTDVHPRTQVRTSPLGPIEEATESAALPTLLPPAAGNPPSPPSVGNPTVSKSTMVLSSVAIAPGVPSIIMPVSSVIVRFITLNTVVIAPGVSSVVTPGSSIILRFTSSNTTESAHSNMMQSAPSTAVQSAPLNTMQSVSSNTTQSALSNTIESVPSSATGSRAVACLCPPVIVGSSVVTVPEAASRVLCSVHPISLAAAFSVVEPSESHALMNSGASIPVTSGSSSVFPIAIPRNRLSLLGPPASRLPRFVGSIKAQEKLKGSDVQAGTGHIQDKAIDRDTKQTTCTASSATEPHGNLATD